MGYELLAGSRVGDAVQAAGGLAAEADGSAINLAAWLEDGQSLVIPTRAALVTPPAQRGSPLVITIEPASAHLIDINTAALADLDGLPDIGPVITQRIIDYRTMNGPFETVEEIMKVQGIGPVVFDQIKELITVTP